ncbi:hypothetical protein K504DRAFT_466311, partial [Pleomassaria siparia CBS 279.74]
MLDQSLSRAASYLQKVDEPTYTRIRQSHQDITKAVLSSLCGHAGAEGGISSIIAVSISTGAGTSYHYNKGDDTYFYSIILVLSTGGLLKLPKVSYKMYVNPGDVTDRLAMQLATLSPYNNFYRHET